MDQYLDDTPNPFDRLLKNPDLDMLNAALPYISNDMRKPLALAMKFSEINRIMTGFDREEVLSSCGFEQNNGDPETMLRAMKLASGGKATPQIDSMLSMMQMVRTYQTFTEFMQNNPEMMNFLTSMMNQKSSSNPMDALKQFSTGKDGDNTMNMLQELLKNTNFPR